MGTPRRIKSVDTLRGIAICLVLGRHVLTIPNSLPISVRLLFEVWREIGWIGVDLFFVLSGFLVSGLLFEEFKAQGTVDLIRFFIRRGFKIYPSFYVFILISILSSCTLHLFPQPTARAILGEVLFLQGYVGSIWIHTWSLSVEEHFYLIIGILVLWWSQRTSGKYDPFTGLPNFILKVAIIETVARCIFVSILPTGAWSYTLAYTHFRIDSLLFGVLVSYYYHFKFAELHSFVLNWRRPLLLFGMIVSLMPLVFPLEESKIMYSVGFTFLYTGFGGWLLVSLIERGSNGNLPAPLMQLFAAVGQRSYPIYLWHMAAYYAAGLIIAPLEISSFFANTTIYLIGSFAGGWWAAKLIERPALKIRDHFFPAR